MADAMQQRTPPPPITASPNTATRPPVPPPPPMPQMGRLMASALPAQAAAPAQANRQALMQRLQQQWAARNPGGGDFTQYMQGLYNTWNAQRLSPGVHTMGTGTPPMAAAPAQAARPVAPPPPMPQLGRPTAFEPTTTLAQLQASMNSNSADLQRFMQQANQTNNQGAFAQQAINNALAAIQRGGYPGMPQTAGGVPAPGVDYSSPYLTSARPGATTANPAVLAQMQQQLQGATGGTPGASTGAGTATRSPEPATNFGQFGTREQSVIDQIRRIDSTFSPGRDVTLAGLQSYLASISPAPQPPGAKFPNEDEPPGFTGRPPVAPPAPPATEPGAGTADQRMVDRIRQFEPTFRWHPNMTLAELTEYHRSLATRGTGPVQSTSATATNPNAGNVFGGTFRPQFEANQPALYGYDPGLVTQIQQIDPNFQAPLGATDDYLRRTYAQMVQAQAAQPPAPAQPTGGYWDYFNQMATPTATYTAPMPARR